jgi:hypothetical protein
VETVRAGLADRIHHRPVAAEFARYKCW